MIAGVGDGNMTRPALEALAKAAKTGLSSCAARACRGPGAAKQRGQRRQVGFVASGELNPAKSRVLLQLALTKTKDPKRVQQMFYAY